MKLEINQPMKQIQNTLSSIPELSDIQLLETNQSYSTIQCEATKDIRENVFDLAVEHNWKIRHLTIEETSLESIFLSLTKDEQ